MMRVWMCASMQSMQVYKNRDDGILGGIILLHFLTCLLNFCEFRPFKSDGSSNLLTVKTDLTQQ